MSAESSTMITLGGKGPSLSSSSVFKVASNVANVRVDSSAIERLSTKNLKSVKRSSFGIPEGLSNEEMRASLVVILNKLLLSNSGPILPVKIAEILNSKNLSLESGEIDVTESEILVLEKSYASLIGLFSIIDHKSTTLSQIGDSVAALRCEATESDITSFSSLDTGDENGDNDAISVASDLRVLLNGSKAIGKLEIEEISKTPWIHGKFREVVRNVHLTAQRELNSGVKGGKTGSGNSGLGESLGATLSALSVPIKSFGECSFLRGRKCFDLIRNENVRTELFELFGLSLLDDKLKMAHGLTWNALSEEDYCRFAHELNLCLGIVWKIVCFEAASAFYALAGGELFGEKIEEKAVLGKGTSLLIQFFRDTLVIGNEKANFSEQILNLLHPEGHGFDTLLEKVKQIGENVSSLETPQQKVSEDCLAVFQRNTRSRTSMGNSETIPAELMIDILSRLPAKFLIRSRGLSKLWDSILRGTYFTELFIKRSLPRPQILFACHGDGQLYFFSTPQVHNLDEKSFLVTPHMSFPFGWSSKMHGPVRGLVCLKHIQISNGSKETMLVICNPSTGQSLPLPRINTSRDKVHSFFGYDPVEKQYKVLSMTTIARAGERWLSSDEYQVLTLGTRNLSWRMIECSKPHLYLEKHDDGICINGSLYYIAQVVNDESVPVPMIVCFDIKSEKFSLIEKHMGADAPMVLWMSSALVNYKGQLGVLVSDKVAVVAESTRLELWVLVNTEKHEWLKRVFVLPPSWKNLVREDEFVYVGGATADEIVLSLHTLFIPFYLLYCNMEKHTIRRVQVQGMDTFRNGSVYPKLGHVENLELM